MEITIYRFSFVRSVGVSRGRRRKTEEEEQEIGFSLFSTRNPGNCFCFPKKSGVKNPPWVATRKEEEEEEEEEDETSEERISWR